MKNKLVNIVEHYSKLIEDIETSELNNDDKFNQKKIVLQNADEKILSLLNI